VHKRALRKRRIRDGAWALLVALLPATVSWSAGRADDSAASPTTTPAATTADGIATTPSDRPKIPPPRRFASGWIPANSPAPVVSKIPAPRAFGPASVPAVPDAPSVTAGPAPTTTVPLLDPTPVADVQPGHAPQANAVPSPGPTPAPVPMPEPAPMPAPAPMPEPAPVPAPAPAPMPEPTPAPMPAPTPESEPVPPAILDEPAPAAIAEPAPTPQPPVVNPEPAAGPAASSSAVPTVPSQNMAVKSTSDAQVQPTACASCGGFHGATDGVALHDSLGGCADGTCIPGRQACYPPPHDSDSICGAFLSNLYQCLCCPDPCYQPRWEPAANASFFADYARPRTVTRFRYDNLNDMRTPDRAQFFIQNVKGPSSGTKTFIPQARYQQVSFYQEVAAGRGSFFFSMPYNQINPNWAPTSAGFGDLYFGTKSLLFDCEMLQVSFQFRTYMPTGNSTSNLGTGHISLDPSILASLKLTPTTYMQGQIGNMIPIGFGGSNGTPSTPLAGGVLYWFGSVNQVLWYATPNSPLIATLEMTGWSFENSGYTASVGSGGKPNIVEKGGGVSYFNIGPGLRQVVCDKMDIGGVITFSTTSPHWADPWFRFEVRFLF
jgi:hypothetical protein